MKILRVVAVLLAAMAALPSLADSADRPRVTALADRFVAEYEKNFPVSYAFSGLPLKRMQCNVELQRLGSQNGRPSPTGESLAQTGADVHGRAAHGDGGGGPVHEDGETDRFGGRDGPGMWIGSEGGGSPAEWDDFGEQRGAIGVSNKSLLRGFQSVSAAPEIMKGVIDANHADAEFVGEF